MSGLPNVSCNRLCEMRNLPKSSFPRVFAKKGRRTENVRGKKIGETNSHKRNTFCRIVYVFFCSRIKSRFIYSIKFIVLKRKGCKKRCEKVKCFFFISLNVQYWLVYIQIWMRSYCIFFVIYTFQYRISDLTHRKVFKSLHNLKSA